MASPFATAEEKIPEREWRRLLAAHQDAQRTGICEIHQIKMHKESVLIKWGEIEAPAPNEPSPLYRFLHFPNYHTFIAGGCCIVPGKDRELVFICPECKASALKWEKEKSGS